MKFPYIALIASIFYVSFLPYSKAVDTPVVIEATATAGGGPYTHVTWAVSDMPEDNTVIPCPSSACLYGLKLGYVSGITPLNETFAAYTVQIKSGTTWSDAAKLFVKKYGESGSLGYQWNWRPAPWAYCIGVTINNARPGYGYPIVQNESSCMAIPVSATTCSVTGSGTIDHGSLGSAQIDGAEASTDLLMECSDPATVKLRLLPEKIDLGGGVSSTITVNGMGNGETLTSMGSSILNVKSHLKGNHPTAGEYSGSAILSIEVQ